MELSALKKGIISVSIIILSLVLSGGGGIAGIPTDVVVNKSILLNLKKPAERVSVPKDDIADVVLISPTQLQINGKTPGSTNLIVWEKGGQAAFFDLNVVGDVNQVAGQIKDAAPNDSINVDYAKDTVILSGKAANEKTIEKAIQIAKVYSPNVINHVKIDDPPQVVLEVKVAQVDKTSMKKLGISYMIKGRTAEGFVNLISAPNGSAQGNTQLVGSGGQTISQNGGSGTGISGNLPGLGSFNPLDAFQGGISYFPAGVGVVIQALAEKGLAKVLAEPNLLVKSGQEGEFLAGSQIPLTVLQTSGGQSTATIIYKDVGVKLKFKPEVLENGVISLKIDPAEVSTIQGFLPINGYPIIDDRRVTTHADLREGESLLLAGILTQSDIKNMSKIPLLGDIPILGALFRSTSTDIQEKELVFFITPRLAKAAAPGTKPELPTDKVTPEQKKELQWIPVP
jgi:pilus assembly protein CpaC